MTEPKSKRGGSRPGAGRPKSKPQLVSIPETNDPLVFLAQLMNNPLADVKLRLDAAKALMPYAHIRKDAVGSKQAAADLARTIEIGSDWEGLLQTAADFNDTITIG